MTTPQPPRAAGSRLPVYLTRFVGRSVECARVRELMGGARLLTVTGPGGSGKTRLVLEVALALEAELTVPVWWVELAAVADPTLVPETLATALQLVEEPGLSRLDAVVAAVGLRPAVLVMDNCEHLVDTCAKVADRLLRSCPDLTILATSREALGVAGETAWLVPPLSLPGHGPPAASVEALERSEAVALFVDRAGAVVPGFGVTAANAAAVAAICRRLDGVPLAIELAAARVKVLTPAQILQRLDDCFSLLVHRGRTALSRHQTIRAAIDWSYDLLLPGERLLLQRLSVFSGDFTLEAAEEVCAGGCIEAQHVLDLVAALVERSLVVMREQDGHARYRLLEVVRQYAAERLAASDSVAARVLARRHAEFFAAWAAATGPRLDVFQSPDAMEAAAAELDNLRAALEWALHAGEAELALRISGGLCPLWLHGTRWSEGYDAMSRVLAAAGSVSPGEASGRALLGAGSLAHALHDFRRARDYWGQAERVLAELDSPRYLALLHANLGQLQIHLGDPDAALHHAQQAVRHGRDAGDPCVLSHVLATGLGFVHAFRGEAELADTFCAEAQQIALREQYHWGMMVTSFSRAMTAWMYGDVEAAARHAAPCVRATHFVRSPWFLPRVLLVPAAVAAHRGDLPRAARLVGACDALRSSLSGRLLAVEQPYFDGLVETVQVGLDPVACARARAEGASLGIDALLEEAAAAVASSPAPPVARDAGVPAVGAAAPHGTYLIPDAGASRAGGSGGGAPLVLPAAGVAARSSAGAAALRVRALGPLEIHRGGELLGTEHWSYAKPRELLLYLLCHPEGRAKEQIGGAIWPEATPAQLRNNLHVTLHYLRKALGATGWIVYVGDCYRLDRDRGVDFDLERFQTQAAALLDSAEPPTDEAVREVLELYHGDFLAAERFGAWHYEWRDAAQRRWVELLALLADRCFQRAEYADAARLYQRITRCEELREDFHRRLMICLARSGDRGLALRHCEGLIALLRQELDADPEAETTELCERLRRAEAV